jgi:hypothetical protein
MAILDKKLKKDFEHKKGVISSKTRIDTGSHIYRGPFFLEDKIPDENTIGVVKKVQSDPTNSVVWYRGQLNDLIINSNTTNTNTLTCMTTYPTKDCGYFNFVCTEPDLDAYFSCISAFIAYGLPPDTRYCLIAYCNYGYYNSYCTYSYSTTSNCGGGY